MDKIVDVVRGLRGADGTHGTNRLCHVIVTYSTPGDNSSAPPSETFALRSTHIFV
jgi:hypothetical protein